MNDRIKPLDAFKKVENLKLVRVMRSGLIQLIPVLTIGAFALVLKTFPIEAYQTFINSFAAGFLASAFNIVYCATFGVLSMYMALFISKAFVAYTEDPGSSPGGAYIAALLSFFALSGVDLDSFGIESMGPKSMILAIITGIGASAMYLALNRLFKRRKIQLMSAGANAELNDTIYSIFSIAATAVAFTMVNLAVVKTFNVGSFRELMAVLMTAVFSRGDTGFFKGFFFVMVSSLLWFFGIHGNDAMENVAAEYLIPGIAKNQEMIAAGMKPTIILSKGFIDCFVLIGGCGTALCILIALLVFSKNRAEKRLCIAATAPMLLNINEIMVFGLPIIYNPLLLIPFVLTPLVCYTVAYAATALGIVPVITNEVAWTTPIFLSGYLATGSIAGSILQLVNLLIGILIYLPFVKRIDAVEAKDAAATYIELVEFFKKNEKNMNNIHITGMDNNYGRCAKNLCVDIQENMAECMHIAYQPQCRYDGTCAGVEALLRWKHPIYGAVYPPMVMKLADEGNILTEMETYIFRKVVDDLPKVKERFGKDVKVSINITAATACNIGFIHFCEEMNEKNNFKGKNIYVEVTEQEPLLFDDNTTFALRTLRDMGLLLSIDDFSAGSTSLHYIKDNLFDELKLDGSLVRGMLTHKNGKEIVASVIQLAKSTNMEVVAEFVETEDQRDALNELGCDYYQGYLFSPAVELNA